jgi:hypothetical protein
MERVHKMAEIFPLVIAQGDAFCNRVEEQALLKFNIQHLKHTLLIAPRRYGKTSLATKVLTDMRIPSQCIDLFTITDEASVIRQLCYGITCLITKILPSRKNLFNRISTIFQRFNPTLEVSLAGQKLKFQVNEKQSTPEDIIELLDGLDKIAKEEHVIAVLNIDEFQQIRTIKNHIAIEGAIRHSLERSQAIMYLFSGSTRHLLNSQFDDQASPLFKSCHKCILERIHGEDYRKHLTEAAKKCWNTKMQAESINRIIELTKCHSYYVNALSSMLWREKLPPNIETVNKQWDLLARMEKANFIQIVMKLSTNQRAMLLGLAKHPTTAPTSQEFLTIIDMASASANQALQVLLENDLVYVDKDNRFHVLDPLLEYALESMSC